MTTRTLTIRDVVEAYDQITRLSAMKLAINPSFWVARMARKLRPDYETFVEKRNELVKQCGVESPAGSGTWSVPPEKIQAFNDALAPLLKESLTLDLDQRPLAYLGELSVEPAILAALHFLFTDAEQ